MRTVHRSRTENQAGVHGRRVPLAMLILSALVAGCAVDPDRPAPPRKSPVVSPAPADTRTPDTRRLRIAAVGDIMLGTDYPEDILPDDDGVGFLAEVTPILAAADIAVGNLEGVLMEGGEPAKECRNPRACYLFRSPPRYAKLLAAAGFDALSLANNHARDFGEEGRGATMEALDAAGIRHSGRFGDTATWEVDGLRVAMLAFSPTVDAWPLLNIPVAAAIVRELARTHSVVIVSFHGGAEGVPGAERLGFGMEYAFGEMRGEVVRFARTVIDAGADFVFGHGPHLPRALELYRGRLIAYSLGNFATYYGISVKNEKGYAPIVIAEVDSSGRFVGGEIVSAVQVRPGGPRPDPERNALRMMRRLTALEFPDGDLRIRADGTLEARR